MHWHGPNATQRIARGSTTLELSSAAAGPAVRQEMIRSAKLGFAVESDSAPLRVGLCVGRQDGHSAGLMTREVSIHPRCGKEGRGGGEAA